MSFEGARFCSYDSPRALSHTQSHCLFRRFCIVASLRYLIYPSHILSHLFSRSLLASQWLFYWAALKPDVPVLRRRGGRWGTAAKGRCNQMTCSFRVAHSPHNRLFSNLFIYLFFTPYLHFSYPPFLPLFLFSYFFPRISLTLYTQNTHTHIHKLTFSTPHLPPPCLSCNTSDLLLSWTYHLIWIGKEAVAVIQAAFNTAAPHARDKRCDLSGLALFSNPDNTLSKSDSHNGTLAPVIVYTWAAVDFSRTELLHSVGEWIILFL